MLILLPPSEGKTAPARRGRPVDPDALWLPGLGPARAKVLDALIELSGSGDALDALGVGASLQAEVAANTRLRELPARPAIEVYSGVLYAALDWPTLPADARRRGNRQLVVISALWGAVRPNDRIPPYRLSMDVDLPGVGRLARFWKSALTPALADHVDRAEQRSVIVDCRSQTYAAAWTPPAQIAERVAAVRVWQDGPSGRTVVSHLAKHTRGLIARDLLLHGGKPRTVPQVAEQLQQRWDVEPVPPARPGKPWLLDVVQPPVRT